MIALLIVFLLVLPAILVAGLGAVRIAGWPESLADPQDRYLAASWTGLAAMASLLLAIACFMPVKPWMIVAFFAPLLSARVRREFLELASNRPTALTLSILTPAVAFFESGPERLYDAALYHNQLIRWIAGEGIVPGLALIHYRLSFSGSWFAAGALFDQPPWESRLARFVSGAVLILLFTQLSLSLARASRRNGTARDWYSIAGIPPLIALAHWQAMNVSASPSWGAAAAVFACGWLLVDGASALALVLSGGGFAIKLIAAPMVVAALSRFRLRVFLLAAALGVPLLMANYRASGCPLFPAPLFCSGSAPGGGEELARRVEAETRNLTRHGGKIGAPLSDLNWLPRWWMRSSNKVLLALLIVAFAVHAWFRRWTRASTLAVIGLAYVVFFAPNLRFYFGFAAVMCGATAAIALKTVPLPRFGLGTWAGITAAVLIAVGLAGDQKGYVQRGDPRLAFDSGRFLLPVAGDRHTEPPMEWQVNGLRIIRPPIDDRCGTLPIPCTPYPPDPALRLCDPARGLRGGFCRKVD